MQNVIFYHFLILIYTMLKSNDNYTAVYIYYTVMIIIKH